MDQVCGDNFTLSFHLVIHFDSPQVTLFGEQVIKKNFRNHVIVGVIADKESSVLGLKNLIMPLRASNIR